MISSQVRGPKCARRFANRLDAVLTENESRPEVQILAGGFQTFVKVRFTIEMMFLILI